VRKLAINAAKTSRTRSGASANWNTVISGNRPTGFGGIRSRSESQIPSAPTLYQTLQALHHLAGPLHIVHSSNALFTRAYQLWSRFQFQWYDSLIVAAGVEAGCDVLYSEDLQDGLDIDDMRIVNPFKTSEAGLN